MQHSRKHGPPSARSAIAAAIVRRPQPGGGGKLAEVRAASDRALALPMSGRDPAVMKGFLPGLAQVVGILEPLLNRLKLRSRRRTRR